ncbi:MAG: p-hydroxycinnamoyl CoA hydratase/lyase [Hyphomicrobiales bacterium]|nr:p-hydroxycinnamoyl CoA hydratase/lyase [Hyphomicrobiales bacterium]
MADDVITLETVKIERDGGSTFIILNRPDKRNAMSPQLHLDMCEALDWAEEDEQTKVVIITGAGGHFCAGQDLKLYFRGTEDDPKARTRARRAAHEWRWNKLSMFPKATIAMVHGYCFGGGFTPVIACDFAVAADDAVFGLSEVNWGIIPGGLVAWAVTEVMGYRDAIYYSVTGDKFSGAEAAQMKFVNKSVPVDKLREEVLALARKLEAKSPAAVRYTKEALRSVRRMTKDQALDYLNCKSDALKHMDPENGREKAMKQFLDDKVFKPGLGEFVR